MFSSSPAGLLFLLTLSLHVLAHPHATQRQLPSQWDFPEDHPVRALFKRQVNVPPIGSPGWYALYPGRDLDLSRTPRAWTDALNAAVAAGRIPNIPIPKDTGGNPAYPPGTNLSGPVCSTVVRCRAPSDVWDSPPGNTGISFDDGPVAGHTEKLLGFLKSQNQVATHFLIGVAITAAPQSFLQIHNSGDDIAVHTWTHPHMSTLSNEAILAQLGWTMQIIADSTGGRVPRFWRPPYGDADNRVRAIALEVFGLTAVFWNRDTADWTLSVPNGTTVAKVDSDVRGWLLGPKNPGLMILNHELSDGSVQAFIDTYPLMAQNGWTPVSVARLVKSGIDGSVGRAYWNGPNGGSGNVLPLAVGDRQGINAFTGSVLPSSISTTSTSTTSTSTSASTTTTVTTTVSSQGSSSTDVPGRASSAGRLEVNILLLSMLWTLVYALAL